MLESSAQQAFLVGGRHNIAGRHVTVQPARAASLSYNPRTNSDSRPGKGTINSGHLHNQIRSHAEQAASTRYLPVFELQLFNMAAALFLYILAHAALLRSICLSASSNVATHSLCGLIADTDSLSNHM